MATKKGKSQSALGTNPLSQGIFSKTVESPEPNDATNTTHEAETTVSTVREKQELSSARDGIKNKESRFLTNAEKEKVNLRLTVELNDWLDDLLKRGKRQHGHKIAKEIWVQAALEFFKALPIDWLQIDSEESLQTTLLMLESRIKNQDN